MGTTHKKINLGIACGVLSGICFGAMAFIISSSREEASSVDFLIGRGAISVLYVLFATLIVKDAGIVHTPSLPVFSRSFLATLAIAINYFVIQKVGAGLGRAVSAFNPIFSIIITHSFFREKLSGLELFGITLAAVGISAPLFFEDKSEFIFLMLGVCAAFISSLSSQTLKVALKKSNDYILIFYLGLFQIIIGLGLFFSRGKFSVPSTQPLIIISAAGIISLVGQVLMTEAFRCLSVPVATSLVLFSIPVGLIFEYIIGGNTPTFANQVTIMLLLFGNLIVTLGSSRRKDHKIQ